MAEDPVEVVVGVVLVEDGVDHVKNANLLSTLLRLSLSSNADEKALDLLILRHLSKGDSESTLGFFSFPLLNIFRQHEEGDHRFHRRTGDCRETIRVKSYLRPIEYKNVDFVIVV